MKRNSSFYKELFERFLNLDGYNSLLNSHNNGIDEDLIDDQTFWKDRIRASLLENPLIENRHKIDYSEKDN